MQPLSQKWILFACRSQFTEYHDSLLTESIKGGNCVANKYYSSRCLLGEDYNKCISPWNEQAYVVEISMTFYGEKKQALYEND